MMLKRFLGDERGNVAILGSLLLLPILMLAGVSVEYTRIENARGEMQVTVDHAARDPLVLFADRPAAEKMIKDFINANSGRDTASVAISIHQNKLRIEAKDELSTPLLSIIGHAISLIETRVDVIVPESKGRVKTNSQAKGPSGKNVSQKRKNAAKLKQLKRYEASLERSIKRLKKQQSRFPSYTRKLTKKLRKQLRDVRYELRKARNAAS